MKRCAAPLIATVVLGLAALPAAAAGLDCGRPPVPLLQADVAFAKVITSPERTRGTDSALAAAIGALRRDGVRNALIADHAISAYCPLVAADGSLSPGRKREDVRRFASDVTDMVYGGLDPSEAESAVILSLPVKPALSDRIDAAAAEAGQTRDAWITRAIVDKLGGS